MVLSAARSRSTGGFVVTADYSMRGSLQPHGWTVGYTLGATSRRICEASARESDLKSGAQCLTIGAPGSPS